MKTIDAVIEQCEEIANASKQHTLHMTHFSQSYDEWAEEWTQIAEWLKELKAYKENTCGDAVSRQAAISAIEALQLPIMREASTCYQFKFSGMSEAKEVVENLPSVTPQQRTGRWIPVSERLPEDGEEVLCYLESEEMAVLFRRNNWGEYVWVDGGFATGSYDVIAWMPLPEPYKAESEVQE